MTLSSRVQSILFDYIEQRIDRIHVLVTQHTASSPPSVAGRKRRRQYTELHAVQQEDALQGKENAAPNKNNNTNTIEGGYLQEDMESQGNEKAVDLQEALIHEANYLLTYSNIVKGWTRQMTLTSDCSSSSSQETDSSQKPVCIKVIHTGVMKGEEEGLRAMQIMVDYHVQRAKLAGELDRLPASGEGRLAYKKAIRCMEQVQEFQTMYLLRKVEDTYLLFWDAAKELFDSTN